MDIKKITHNLTNKMEGVSLALPMFVVGLGFIILGVTLFPGIGILLGIFIWWLAWRFMLSSTRKNRIREAIKRIKERQAALLSSSISKDRTSTPKADVENKSGAESTDTSERQETAVPGSDH
jgi:ABC-type bacteriocin/lantibiotic exporter with double-glycine peptidase domain